MSESDIFSNNVFDDDLFQGSAKCSPITQAELDMADSFDALPENTPVKLIARVEESRDGEARTAKVQKIEGYGPVLFSSEVFSMHRLLWADGVMANKDTTKAETTNTKATLAVFKVNLESHSDRPVLSARIQVEFHGIGRDADTVGAKRPCVVGWAPFATMERPNETTAQHTRNSSLKASLRAGPTEAGATVQATASSTSAWEKRYFDKYRSKPVSVLGVSGSGTGSSSDFNGVAWTMEMNSLARDGVVPELLMYMLVTRQDDSEYAVKITATVATHKHFERVTKHKCVLRVTPKEPSLEKPTMSFLEGVKMWKSLDVNHLETLLSPKKTDSSLVLPWDVEETAPPAAGTIGTKNSEAAVPENGNEDEAAEGEDNLDEGDAAQTEPEPDPIQPIAAPSVAVSIPLTNEGSVELTPAPASAAAATGRNVATPLADKAAILDALGLLGLPEGDNDNVGDEEEDLPTRVAMLESRMEVMEYRMARQALVIRALLKKHKGH